MDKSLGIAFVGGGNMASALASGLIGKHCKASNLHVIDINEKALTAWSEKGASVSVTPSKQLSNKQVWVLSVKPQFLKEAVQACKPYLTPETLVISVAAGVSAQTLGRWLGTENSPWTRLIRCMPNTPALVGQGATGMFALSGIDSSDRELANQLLSSVGQVTWVNNDSQLDAVTALSGSGPAYVFLFLEALIQGGVEMGLNQEDAKQLALATVKGATILAEQSTQELSVLREQVTSKGGTTAAALSSFNNNGFSNLVLKAMQAAYVRAAELSEEFN